MSNLIGMTLLNRYRVDAFIAASAKGVVYRGWETQRNVPLALKVLRTDLAESAAVLKYFQDISPELRKLSHPRLASFYGLFRAEEATFLLEQFIEGVALPYIQSQSPGQPMPIKQALVYMKALCTALGYLHEMGWVHGAVKPANLLIDQKGEMFLTDIGTCMRVSSRLPPLANVANAAYLTPEQIRSEPVTPATDIYLLGLVMYELLTGRKPFAGSETVSYVSSSGVSDRLRLAHLNTPPPDPLQINPQLPRDLVPLLLVALQKDPKQRYQSTTEMFDMFCAVMNIQPGSIPNRVTAPTMRAEALQPEIAPAQVQPEIIPVPPKATWGETARMPTPEAVPSPAEPALETMKMPSAEAAVSPARWFSNPIVIIVGLLVLGCLGVAIGFGIMSLTGLFAAPAPSETPLFTFTVTATGVLGGSQRDSPTPMFTDTLPPRPTNTLAPTQRPTNTPFPTITPAPSKVTVRIRNRTGYPVSLYRYGTTGERHYLGWLNPNFYGEYPFPGLGSWVIEWCKRAEDGSTSNCKKKTINVNSPGQEFTVP